MSPLVNVQAEQVVSNLKHSPRHAHLARNEASAAVRSRDDHIPTTEIPDKRPQAHDHLANEEGGASLPCMPHNNALGKNPWWKFRRRPPRENPFIVWAQQMRDNGEWDSITIPTPSRGGIVTPVRRQVRTADNDTPASRTVKGASPAARNAAGLLGRYASPAHCGGIEAPNLANPMRQAGVALGATRSLASPGGSHAQDTGFTFRPSERPQFIRSNTQEPEANTYCKSPATNSMPNQEVDSRSYRNIADSYIQRPTYAASEKTYRARTDSPVSPNRRHHRVTASVDEYLSSVDQYFASVGLQEHRVGAGGERLEAPLMTRYRDLGVVSARSSATPTSRNPSVPSKSSFLAIPDSSHALKVKPNSFRGQSPVTPRIYPFTLCRTKVLKHREAQPANYPASGNRAVQPGDGRVVEPKNVVQPVQEVVRVRHQMQQVMVGGSSSSLKIPASETPQRVQIPNNEMASFFDKQAMEFQRHVRMRSIDRQHARTVTASPSHGTRIENCGAREKVEFKHRIKEANTVTPVSKIHTRRKHPRKEQPTLAGSHDVTLDVDNNHQGCESAAGHNHTLHRAPGCIPSYEGGVAASGIVLDGTQQPGGIYDHDVGPPSFTQARKAEIVTPIPIGFRNTHAATPTGKPKSPNYAAAMEPLALKGSRSPLTLSDASESIEVYGPERSRTDVDEAFENWKRNEGRAFATFANNHPRSNSPSHSGRIKETNTDPTISEGSSQR